MRVRLQKAQREIVDAIKKDGIPVGEIKHQGNGHITIFIHGQRLTVGNSSSDKRSIKNALSDARRIHRQYVVE